MSREGREKKLIQLPPEIVRGIVRFGEPVRGYTPEQLLEGTRFYQMPRNTDVILTRLGAPRWGMCTRVNEIIIDPDWVPVLREDPWSYTDEVWHELVHVAQRRQKGDGKFLADYLWDLLKHWFQWKKVYLEREAFQRQERFLLRMAAA